MRNELAAPISRRLGRPLRLSVDVAIEHIACVEAGCTAHMDCGETVYMREIPLDPRGDGPTARVAEPLCITHGVAEHERQRQAVRLALHAALQDAAEPLRLPDAVIDADGICRSGGWHGPTDADK